MTPSHHEHPIEFEQTATQLGDCAPASAIAQSRRTIGQENRPNLVERFTFASDMAKSRMLEEPLKGVKAADCRAIIELVGT